jgi:hypothetical protein
MIKPELMVMAQVTTPEPARHSLQDAKRRKPPELTSEMVSRQIKLLPATLAMKQDYHH